MFQDRRNAGQILAELIAALPDLSDAVILALPRGGVPVAFEVARACNLPLDVLVVRKLGTPGQRELAMGAVASGGTVVFNPAILRAFHFSPETLRKTMDRAKREIERLEIEYRDGHPPINIEAKTVILIDDGLATGASMRAAIQSVQPHAKRVVVAVPVGARSSCEELLNEVDRVVCAETPEPFEAVSAFYRNFDQTSDEEVRLLLALARRESQSDQPDAPAPPLFH